MYSLHSLYMIAVSPKQYPKGVIKSKWRFIRKFRIDIITRIYNKKAKKPYNSVYSA
eukprot:UN20188